MGELISGVSEQQADRASAVTSTTAASTTVHAGARAVSRHALHKAVEAADFCRLVLLIPGGKRGGGG